MSQTTTTELQDRAETITSHFDAITMSPSDESALEGETTRQAIEQNLDKLVAHQVPVDEAVRTVVRGVMRDAGLKRSDLPAELATLAGYSVGSQFERTMLGDVAEADQWIDVVAEVVELWKPRSEKIAQVGLLGDESGRLKFVTWESANLPELVEGETYQFQNAVTDEYQGRYSVSLNSASAVGPSEEAVSTAAEGVTVGGAIVAIQEGSGLIKRCPESDCTRVLSGERCAEHGDVEGAFDLRIKAVVDDGSRSINAIFDAAATTAVSGLSMADAQAMAMDALDTSVVVDELAERVFGRPYRITGPVVGEYFLVDDVAQGSAEEDLSNEALESAVTARQPARRMLAQEINASTHTFQASDEERAPVLSLSPTGVAVNRVLIVGALTETRDVGSSTEYWRGRVYAGSESVFVYAGQYQPEAMEFLQQAVTPSYVAVVGKLRSYEAGDRVNVAIEPESIATVDETTREAWLAEAVEHTTARIAAFERGAAQAAAATEHYGDDLGQIGNALTDAMTELGLDAESP